MGGCSLAGFVAPWRVESSCPQHWQVDSLPLDHQGRPDSVFVFLIYLFLAVLSLHCFAQTFSSCSEQGLLSGLVSGFLITVASLVAEHRL